MITKHINDTLASDARRQRGNGREDRCLWHFEQLLILPEGLSAINGGSWGMEKEKSKGRRKCFQQRCEGALITLFRRSGIRVWRVSQSIRVQVLPFATPAQDPCIRLCERHHYPAKQRANHINVSLVVRDGPGHGKYPYFPRA